VSIFYSESLGNRYEFGAVNFYDVNVLDFRNDTIQLKNCYNNLNFNNSKIKFKKCIIIKTQLPEQNSFNFDNDFKLLICNSLSVNCDKLFYPRLDGDLTIATGALVDIDVTYAGVDKVRESTVPRFGFDDKNYKKRDSVEISTEKKQIKNGQLTFKNANEPPVTNEPEPINSSIITIEDIENAIEEWGNALVGISNDNFTRGLNAAIEEAIKAIDFAYGYDIPGNVLFKPTLTQDEHTFRPTKEGALAYFVGGNVDFPDKGFALSSSNNLEWVSVRSILSYFIKEDIALWQGNLDLTDKGGNVIRVDKSFGYCRDTNRNLRIILHHSSVPYQKEEK